MAIETYWGVFRGVDFRQTVGDFSFACGFAENTVEDEKKKKQFPLETRLVIGSLLMYTLYVYRELAFTYVQRTCLPKFPLFPP